MLKKIIFAVASAAVLALPSIKADAQEIVKTGYNFGPLPALTYDEDKGLQYGALLQIYNYGDGSSYPMYKSMWYFEASAFTKGSQQYAVRYNKLEIFPGVRFFAGVKFNVDTAFDFYGFNGYGAHFDANGQDFANAMADYLPAGITPDGDLPYFRPFYRVKRNMLLTRADFMGRITDHLQWMAGYHFSYFGQGTVNFDNLNKGKAESKQYKYSKTLVDYYADWGIIPEEEKDGGLYSCIRLGLQYDTRDKEGAPSRGIWADAHLNYAPKWLGSSVSTTRYSLTWRHYLPLIDDDRLTFAYRLSYEGTIGDHCPYYLLPYMTVIGVENDFEGMGGAKTCRGIMRGRIVGLDTGLYTAELRWRFLKFQAFNQNIALGLNLFSDGAMAVRGLDTSFTPVNGAVSVQSRGLYDKFVSQEKDTPHITVGGGFRFIMNENFIVAADYGLPVSKFYADTNPHKGQDGNGGLYIGLGYLF